MDKLFRNAGEKLIRYAKWIFLLGAIGAVFSYITLVSAEDDYIIVGIPIIVVGILVAYISALLMSAFGELVESSSQNRVINAKILRILEKKGAETGAAETPKAAPQKVPVTPAAEVKSIPVTPVMSPAPYKPAEHKATPGVVWVCSKCKAINDSAFPNCQSCGTPKTY